MVAMNRLCALISKSGEMSFLDANSIDVLVYTFAYSQRAFPITLDVLMRKEYSNGEGMNVSFSSRLAWMRFLVSW